MSSFSPKIYLAYAMNIIDDSVLHDLNIIRRVRNAFAHAPKPISFSTNEVKHEILKLQCTAHLTISDTSIMANSLLGATHDPMRDRFIVACRDIALLILASARDELTS